MIQLCIFISVIILIDTNACTHNGFLKIWSFIGLPSHKKLHVNQVGKHFQIYLYWIIIISGIIVFLNFLASQSRICIDDLMCVIPA